MIGNRVYHYTTMDTFFHLIESISESKDKNSFVFRATHLFFMNDPQEFVYGQKVLMEILKDIESEKDVPNDYCLSNFFERHKEKSIEEWNQTFLKSIEEQNEIPYAISFSRHEDSLPMWLNYGENGKGICLSFHESELNIAGLSPSDQQDEKIEKVCVLNNYDVYYKPKTIIDHNGHKSWLYKEIKRQYEKLYWDNIQDRDIQNLLKQQIAVIKALTIVECPYIKSIEYEGEKESRIIRSLRRDYNGDLKELHFRCNDKGNIIPYVNMEIPIHMLDYVRIGPISDIELSKKAINMMKKYGLIFDIKESQIQYRDY